MQMNIINNNKGIIERSDQRINSLIRSDNFLHTCFDNSNWDNKNENSSSLAHYNYRLAVSKSLIAALTNKDLSVNFLSLLNSNPCDLSIRDFIHGFKSLEAFLIKEFDNNVAIAYSTGVRHFLLKYGENDSINFPFNFITYDTRYAESVVYKENTDVDFFVIHVNKASFTIVIDPDTLPSLFKKDGLLHHVAKGMEEASAKQPLEYSIVMSFKKTLRDISTLALNSPLIDFLNTPYCELNSASIIDAFISFERFLFNKFNGMRLDQTSSTFRNILSEFGKLNDILNKDKMRFSNNFNSKGKLKFKPPFSVKTTSNKGINNFFIDTFQIPKVCSIDGVATICLTKIVKLSKDTPIDYDKVEQLVELLLKIEKKGPSPARNLLSKSPKKLSQYNVKSGMESIEKIILIHFPTIKFEVLSTLKEFINHCEEKTENLKLIKDLEFDSKIIVKKKVNSIPIKVYTKNNGKKHNHDYQLNIDKVEHLLTLQGTLQNALKGLKRASENEPLTQTQANIIDRALSHIVNTKLTNDKVCKILIQPIALLTQRDFRVGFNEFEDIIEEVDVQVKSNLSLGFRSFLTKWGGKINNEIEIKHCGFNSRFNAKKEMNAPKLITPLDGNGVEVKSPILKKHQSLFDLKKEVSEYYEKPITALLEATNSEIGLYKKLVTTFNRYTEVDQSENYKENIPDEIISFVEESQKTQAKGVLKSKTKALIDSYSQEQLLGAYVRAQLNAGIDEHIYCNGKNLLILDFINHWFYRTAKSMNDYFWHSVLLPRSILLSYFIRFTIRTTWNKDVIAKLKRDDFPEKIPDGEFKIQGYKDKVDKPTFVITIEPHETEIREAITMLLRHYDNMIELGLSPESLWDTPTSTNLSFLSKNNIDRFCEHYGLSKFTIEQLAKHQINLRKGIDGSLANSQIERNHSTSAVTAGYLTHPIAMIEYEASNADFQRRFETTIQYRHAGKDSLKKYKLDEDNIDESLIISAKVSDEEDLPDWFLLPDGSTCSNIFAPIDKDKQDNLCQGRKCHQGDGCEFNLINLGDEEFLQTLQQQEFFIARGEVLLSKHGKEYFDEYIAPEMRFVFGLVRYVEHSNPILYKATRERLNNAN